ncbi:hypothetical protein GCM10027341_35420 [Spirosoma knui]
MAFRSLLVSATVTGFLAYAFTVGITEPSSFLHKLPEWSASVIIIGCAFLYVLAVWWAIKGFAERKLVALVSLLFCLIGLGVYALGISLELGKGRAAPGQYSYDFQSLDLGEKNELTQLLAGTGLQLADAVFTEHWHVADSTSCFRICVQKGHITALNLSGHTLTNLQPISQLPYLSDLFLQNCGLSDMSSLRSERLDRLDLSNNQITDVTTLRGCPNLRWLFIQNNPLQKSQGGSRPDQSIR